MSKMCGIWKEAMEKQDERFSKAMKVQEEAIKSQTEQTKMLIDGLKDMIQNITK